ncbi:MAG: hypothetical protein AAFX94_21660, partial [Myxococcota bacterium]
EKLEERAFDAAWKISSDPLLRLLEDAENDTVCAFLGSPDVDALSITPGSTFGEERSEAVDRSI